MNSFSSCSSLSSQWRRHRRGSLLCMSSIDSRSINSSVSGTISCNCSSSNYRSSSQTTPPLCSSSSPSLSTAPMISHKFIGKYNDDEREATQNSSETRSDVRYSYETRMVRSGLDSCDGTDIKGNSGCYFSGKPNISSTLLSSPISSASRGNCSERRHRAKQRYRWKQQEKINIDDDEGPWGHFVDTAASYIWENEQTTIGLQSFTSNNELDQIKLLLTLYYHIHIGLQILPLRRKKRFSIIILHCFIPFLVVAIGCCVSKHDSWDFRDECEYESGRWVC